MVLFSKHFCKLFFFDIVEFLQFGSVWQPTPDKPTAMKHLCVALYSLAPFMVFLSSRIFIIGAASAVITLIWADHSSSLQSSFYLQCRDYSCNIFLLSLAYFALYLLVDGYHWSYFDFHFSTIFSHANSLICWHFTSYHSFLAILFSLVNPLLDLFVFLLSFIISRIFNHGLCILFPLEILLLLVLFNSNFSSFYSVSFYFLLFLWNLFFLHTLLFNFNVGLLMLFFFLRLIL